MTSFYDAGFTDAGILQTVISSSHFALHFNEKAFPQPHVFNPDRWLGAKKSERDRYLNPYSRGSRACIGIKYARPRCVFFVRTLTNRNWSFSLAQMQLQLTLGHLFGHYEINLCDPVPKSLEWKDHFVATPCSHIKIKIQPRKQTSKVGNGSPYHH
jgi:cytochrome P450